MKPKFDLYLRSRVIRSEKPTKSLTAIPAANQHQMNAIKGFMGGKEVIIAHRSSKGGMDFNKILSGKVYAVAADAVSPVMEKGEDKKPTKIQKLEDGLPYYTTSGFYLLSSPEYPALEILECFTRLHRQGELLLMITWEALKARTKVSLTDLTQLEELIEGSVAEMLSDVHNLVQPFDAKINKKRKLMIDQAKLAIASTDDDDDEPSAEEQELIAYQELTVSPKDGNPFIYMVWVVEGEQPREHIFTREMLMDGEKSQFMAACTTEEALNAFRLSDEYRDIYKALSEGRHVTISMARGNAMRPSRMFTGKIEATLNDAAGEKKFGDPIYIRGALKAWTPGIVWVMHSKHPAFPKKDYDHNYYVAAARQAELGMMKNGQNQFHPPEAVCYDFIGPMLA